MTPGEQYTITVYSVNAMGHSESAVVPFTAATTPIKMKAPAVVVRGHKATVRWEPVAGSGLPINRYLVDVNRGRDRYVDSSRTKVVFRKLQPGRYKFRVIAFNDLGSSPAGARRAVRVR